MASITNVKSLANLSSVDSVKNPTIINIQITKFQISFHLILFRDWIVGSGIDFTIWRFKKSGIKEIIKTEKPYIVVFRNASDRIGTISNSK